jgi:hypothetical protein
VVTAYNLPSPVKSRQPTRSKIPENKTLINHLYTISYFNNIHTSPTENTYLKKKTKQYTLTDVTFRSTPIGIIVQSRCTI